MRNYFTAILLSVICVGCVLQENKANTIEDQNAVKKQELRDIIGVTHVSGKYYLTDKDYLNEGGEKILALGSRVIKVWFHNPQQSYPFNSKWPQMDTLVEMAQSPYFQQLFNKPFTTYIMMCFSLGRGGGYWKNGITEQQKQDEQRQFYELTKHLLTAYQNTGKTFVLQHWESDWLIRGNYDEKTDPTPTAISGMIEWLNARQAGRLLAYQAGRLQGLDVGIFLSITEYPRPKMIFQNIGGQTDVKSENNYPGKVSYANLYFLCPGRDFRIRRRKV